jgi:hypothetical protein
VRECAHVVALWPHGEVRLGHRMTTRGSEWGHYLFHVGPTSRMNGIVCFDHLKEHTVR